MSDITGYEAVIGIEVHAELKTATKIFCSCGTGFGAEPNTQCCPVCMGLPGALPVLNKRVVELCIMAGLALNCDISRFCYHDRKNYFYPDLPKAYQISQLDTPLCRDGYLDINACGQSKRIGIERIHIEEDAGKLIHSDVHGTMIDHNRCGVPLIEIVSRPDMRTADEAKAYLEALRTVLLYAGVSDCKMNEGSLRCDVNVSVRRIGDTGLNTRTEIKNLNSFAFAKKAIEYEIARQRKELCQGGRVLRETRRYDEKSGKTLVMRVKESADDYRYFTDPDLPPFSVDEETVERCRRALPMLPGDRVRLYAESYGIPSADGERIAAEPRQAEYFEAAASLTKYPRVLANLIICELPVLLGGEDFSCSVSPKNFASLCDLQGEGQINSSTSKAVLREMLRCDTDPVAFVRERALLQINDESELMTIIKRVIEQNPQAVADYRSGKTAAAKSVVGKVMGATGGRANPTLTSSLVEQAMK